jgi:membrane protein
MFADMRKRKGMKVKTFFNQLWQTLKRAVPEFINDGAVTWSASLSYYTFFSLPPVLIILISLGGFFYGREAMEGHIYGEIRHLVGAAAAIQVEDIIRHVQLSKDTQLATIISIGALILGATGVFSEIQNSINYIWGIKANPKRGWLKWLLNRLLSFSMIITIGFLMMVSLIISALLDLFSARLQVYFAQLTVEVFYVLNLCLVYVVITVLFTVIFKTLPDGKVNFYAALKGAAFTAFLFMAGKYGIGVYLGNSHVTDIYGAAGSLILIMLWVYYSSIILYFGAEFTKIYALLYSDSIIPNDYAVKIERRVVEKEKPKSFLPTH